jgi:hypothetical protein
VNKKIKLVLAWPLGRQKRKLVSIAWKNRERIDAEEDRCRGESHHIITSSLMVPD